MKFVFHVFPATTYLLDLAEKHVLLEQSLLVNNVLLVRNLVLHALAQQPHAIVAILDTFYSTVTVFKIALPLHIMRLLVVWHVAQDA